MRPENKPPVFVDIIIWGERASKLAKYLTKGKAISVTGRLEIIKTQKNEYIYTTPRVVVETLEFLGRKNIESVSTQQVVNEQLNKEETDETITLPDEEIPF